MESGVKSNFDAQFGKYTLIAKLATGGMGEIFLAKLTGMAGFEKLVVIKRLLPHLAEDSHFVAMLMDEARVAARLSHPNVCQVYDLGEVGGVFYIAMEFLEGVPCSELLKAARSEGAVLPIGMATNILEQSCAGLHHAHELKDYAGNPTNLVHRDVSPSNIFATVSGTVKVLDFGVAKSQDARARTHTGALKGKYAYMSPEQVMAHDIDRRADVFSLGIVLFELLTTRRLFWRESEYKMFQAIAEDPIPDVRDFRADVPGELATIITKALSRDVAGRYPTASAMGTAVSTAMSLHGGLAANSMVAAHVGRTFKKQISERRELANGAVEPHNQPTVADGRADMGQHSREVALADAPEIFIEESPSNLEDLLGDLAKEKAETPQQARRGVGFWLVLAAFGVLVALAGSYLYALISKDDQVTQRRAPLDGEQPDDPDNPKEITADVVPPVIPDEPVDPPVTKPCTVSLPSAKDVRTKAFFGQQGTRVKSCLCKTEERRLAMTLEILIEKDGRVKRAKIVQEEIGKLAVGKCLERAARRTRFPKSGKRLRIKIPLAVNTE